MLLFLILHSWGFYCAIMSRGSNFWCLVCVRLPYSILYCLVLVFFFFFFSSLDQIAFERLATELSHLSSHIWDFGYFSCGSRSSWFSRVRREKG